MQGRKEVMSDSKFLGLDFDPDIFSKLVDAIPDLTRIAFMESGILIPSDRLTEAFSGGGAKTTIPLYAFDMDEESDEWDGVTDVVPSKIASVTQSAVLNNRVKSWKQEDLTDIVATGTKGDSMKLVAARVAKWRARDKQRKIISSLKGLFASTPTNYATEWANHTLDISKASGAPTDANLVGPTTVGDAVVQAAGDNRSSYSVVIAHSHIVHRWRNLQMIEYMPYTHPEGIQGGDKIEFINGLRIFEDDSVPVAPSDAAQNPNMLYTTYIFGTGAILTSARDLISPTESYEVSRDPLKGGGTDFFITRYRDVYHPNGADFKGTVAGNGATKTQLEAGANWDLAYDPKAIAITRIVSNA
jgi:hypothetical protein